jgi:hypothetical protein
MPLEESETIDIVANDESGGLLLVITDAGVTRDPDERFSLLLPKLTTYLRYVFSDAFASDHPEQKPEAVTIKVVCATPPTEQMKGVTEAKHPAHQGLAVPVLFELFEGKGGAAPSAPAVDVDPADFLRGLEKLRNVALFTGVALLVIGIVGYFNKGNNPVPPGIGAAVFIVVGAVLARLVAAEQRKLDADS